MILGLLVIPALVLLASPRDTAAQPAGAVHRIGVISIGGPRTPAFDAMIQPMLEQLRTGGWVEGRTVAFEYRFDEGRRERLPTLARELIDLEVSVIVAVSTPAAEAARRCPPSGRAVRSPNPAPASSIAGILPAAPATAGLKLVPIKAEASPALADVFAEAIDKRCDALLVWPLPRAAGWIREAADLATRLRVPMLGMFRSYVEQGMLMSYAPRTEEQFQRAGTYVDRILRGAKPGNLAIEQPTQFELVVNTRVAKVLGLTIPPVRLLRADRIVD